MSTIALEYDSSRINGINTQKVMVAVPLVYMFMSHYFFQILRWAKGTKQVGSRLNDLGKRLCLFGIACLFSSNFIQSYAMSSVMSWATLILMIIGHCFVFLRQTGQKYHNIVLLIYNLLLTMWFGAGIVYYVQDGSQ